MSVRQETGMNLKLMSSRSVQQVAEEAILENEPPLTYEQVLLRVREELPHASTTVACLRWYAT